MESIYTNLFYESSPFVFVYLSFLAVAVAVVVPFTFVCTCSCTVLEVANFLVFVVVLLVKNTVFATTLLN